MRTVLSYGLREEHIVAFLQKFRELDTHYTGVWGAQEMYALIQEPRMSMRAPMIDTLFFIGMASSEGHFIFQDFLVTMASFCALSREEVLQYLFIILDNDRNGLLSKQELLRFFSYTPIGSGSRQPVCPMNNKTALDKFRKGKWTNLEFDGFAQLCEYFPYISYPAYHTQELYQQALLGKAFWDKLTAERCKTGSLHKKFTVTVPGSKGRQKMEVKMPGRCTMQEMLDYSRRNTEVVQGMRVESQTSGKTSSKLTKETDEQIMRCPIITMIRNPRCMYYVPRTITQKRAERAERAEAEAAQESNATVRAAAGRVGVVAAAKAVKKEEFAMGSFGMEELEEPEDDDEYDDDSDGSYDSEDEEDEEYEDSGGAAGYLADAPLAPQ
uniref:EF-hand domain-containing protein n=1 Tax=Zooxanthella nutricula TaxID=1333877 RepID=A0A7S2LXC1_9DINO